MELIDQSVLETLPAQQRQKIIRQLRQKQIEGYLRFVKKEREGGSINKPCKPNKKHTRPNFGLDILLQDAVENFDDKEVTRSLQHGSNYNFVTGNGTSLLHKCAAEDNTVTAGILISHGADINILDDDWWTPLHTACSCDSSDMVQLLLNNGADISLVDVDGFFPMDHCQDGSDSQHIISRYMEANGIDDAKKKEIQFSRPRQMYNDVQDLLTNGGSPNKVNDNGVSLVHIASANGYKKVLKLLLKNGADMNVADNLYLTPLHVAAKFNQMDTVKTLVKHKADINAVDIDGNKPSAVAGSNEIRALLLKRERKSRTGSVSSELDVTIDNDKDDEDENDGLMGGVIIRINSKTVKPRHTSVGKVDSVLEGRQYVSIVSSNRGGVKDKKKQIDVKDKNRDNISLKEEEDVEHDDDDDDDDDDDEEDIYVSRMWKTIATSQVKLPEVKETDNLKDLSDISEENILSHIQNRFKDSQIYTKIGDVLIAVNPFKELSIYAKQVSTQYHETEDVLSLPPHVYCMAEDAYKSMLKERTSQCCIISGESGAGKSETCKLLVQHLARVTGSEKSNLNSKINQVTPLLEAFGNAQTVINDNSSRFAKFIELMFSQQGRLVGAKLTEYLLEKSRVVYQSEGERNFHIFYWMFAGLTPEEFNLFHLKSVNSHRYVRSRTDLTNKQITDNKEKFWDLKKCLGFIGFSSDDVQNLLLTLAAVIHIGDITFCPHGNTDAAVIVNEEKLEEVATMLDVSPEELGSALVAEYTTTRGEQIKKERTVQHAADCRDALAKAIYSRLFSWIVNGINQLVEPTYHSIEQTYVGILDIFGFENFKLNSFEQICINLANEQMQNFTNEHLFYKEQQDCLLEGVPLVDLNYSNNQAILDTFMEKHTGVLAILDEESRFPKATDMSLAAKLHQGPGKKFTTVYKTPRDGGATFTIVHFAGAVSYDLMGTLDKNRDTLPNAIMYTMKTSNSLLIKDLFQSKITRTGSLAPSARQQRSRRTTSKSPFEFFKKLRPGKPDKTKQPGRPMLASERKGPATMAYHFKCSLIELMTKVQSATPHIIRCLKPNTTKSAMTFIPEYVLAQLRYTGITETIKIKKFGFPHRYKFNEFVNRYKPLVLCCIPTHIMIPDVDKCKEIFKLCLLHEQDGYKVGKTKLFLTDGIVQQIDKANENILKKIVISQSVVRRHIAAQTFKQKKTIVKREAEKREAEKREAEKGEAEKRAEELANKQSKETEPEQLTEDILKTLDNLEDLIDDALYVDAFNLRPDDALYVDAFSPRPYVGPLPEPPEYDAEMNGQVQYRGLPAPPLETLEFDDGMPPPCPREMYSQYGVYDVIPGDPHHQKRHKPATPQRSPSTRLSSQISQDEVFDHNLSPRQQTTSQSPRQSSHHSPYSHISHQQQIIRQQPTSPKMKQKHMSHPDPTQSKPFSYFGSDPVSSRHRHSEGSVRYSSDSNYEQVSPVNYYQNGKSGKPQTGYEYNYPTNYGEPPVVAPQGSPVLQRQSSLTRKVSLSPVTKRRNESPRNGNQRMAHGQRGPPSFPAPTAPGQIRPASPPLPPIPGGFDQPPPPPPIEKIPGHQSVSSFELGKRRRQSAETDINRNQVQDQEKYYPHQQSMDAYNPVLPNQQGQGLLYLQGQGLSHQQGYGSPHQQDPYFPSTQHQQYGAGSPWQQHQQQHYTQPLSSKVPYMAPVPPVSGGLSDQLNKVKLKTKKTGSVDEISSEEKKANILAAELGKVKLKTVKPKETISSVPDKTQEMSTVILPKLKSTGAKPWEKDTSPEQAPRQQDDIDDQFDDDYFPPPPPDLAEIPPPIEAEPVSRIQPMQIQQQKKKGSSEPSLSKMADFDIDLNNIDYSQIPGYVPITEAVPNWKKDMIEKKNQEKVEQYIMHLRRQKEEAEKWKNVPEWKRKILMEKAAMKSDTDEQFAIDEAKKQKEKKERKFDSPDQVKLKPVKNKTEAQPSENNTEPPIPEPKQEVAQPLQEIKQNIPNKQPEVWSTNQTKNIVPTPADINNLPPPPPMVVEKPKKKISVPEPDLPPPPLPPDVQDEEDREEDMRRREERRRQIEAESNEEDSGDLPAWKKEIMMKRGGVPKNWGDEREDINETE